MLMVDWLTLRAICAPINPPQSATVLNTRNARRSGPETLPSKIPPSYIDKTQK